MRAPIAIRVNRMSNASPAVESAFESAFESAVDRQSNRQGGSARLQLAQMP